MEKCTMNSIYKKIKCTCKSMKIIHPPLAWRKKMRNSCKSCPKHLCTETARMKVKDTERR